jgi:copper transport protein
VTALRGPAAAAARRRAAATWPLVLAAGVLAGACLVPAPRALAHATNTRSDPLPGAVLSEPPEHVVLYFDEPVRVDQLEVYDADLARVDRGEPEVVEESDRDVAVRTGLELLGEGTYLVQWRIVSRLDDHPIAGSFSFSVGRPGGGAAFAGGSAGNLPVAGSATVVNVLAYATGALLFGALVFLAVVWLPVARRSPGDGATAAVGRALAGWTRRTWWAALVVSLPVPVTEAAAERGSFAEGLTAPALRDLLGSAAGAAWMARIVLLGAAGIVLVLASRAAPAAPVARSAGAMAALDAPDRRDPPRRRGAAPRTALVAVAVLLSAGIVAAPALSGHTAADAAARAADMAHLIAMGAWVGGLACLIVVMVGPLRGLGRRKRTAILADLVPRFSTLATLMVAVLVATGIYMSTVYVGAWSGLSLTSYGRLLVAKVAVFALVLALGAYNMLRVRPGLRAAREDARGSPPWGARLRGSVLTELVATTTALVLATVLVGLPTAKETGTRQVVVREPVRSGQLEARVFPAETGKRTKIDLTFTTESGALDASVRDARVVLLLPDEELGPLLYAGRPTGPGRLVTDANPVPVAGLWRMDVVVVRDSGYGDMVHLELPITPSEQ